MTERRRSGFAATLALLLWGSPLPAASAPADLSAASCADFGAMTPADREQLSLWLAGYFAGAAQQPLLDIERLAAAPAELGALCEKTPALRLIGVEVRAVFTGKPAQ